MVESNSRKSISNGKLYTCMENNEGDSESKLKGQREKIPLGKNHSPISSEISVISELEEIDTSMVSELEELDKRVASISLGLTNHVNNRKSESNNFDSELGNANSDSYKKINDSEDYKRIANIVVSMNGEEVNKKSTSSVISSRKKKLKKKRQIICDQQTITSHNSFATTKSRSIVSKMRRKYHSDNEDEGTRSVRSRQIDVIMCDDDHHTELGSIMSSFTVDDIIEDLTDQEESLSFATPVIKNKSCSKNANRRRRRTRSRRASSIINYPPSRMLPNSAEDISVCSSVTDFTYDFSHHNFFQKENNVCQKDKWEDNSDLSRVKEGNISVDSEFISTPMTQGKLNTDDAEVTVYKEKYPSPETTSTVSTGHDFYSQSDSMSKGSSSFLTSSPNVTSSLLKKISKDLIQSTDKYCIPDFIHSTNNPSHNMDFDSALEYFNGSDALTSTETRNWHSFRNRLRKKSYGYDKTESTSLLRKVSKGQATHDSVSREEIKRRLLFSNGCKPGAERKKPDLKVKKEINVSKALQKKSSHFPKEVNKMPLLISSKKNYNVKSKSIDHISTQSKGTGDFSSDFVQKKKNCSQKNTTIPCSTVDSNTTHVSGNNHCESINKVKLLSSDNENNSERFGMQLINSSSLKLSIRDVNDTTVHDKMVPDRLCMTKTLQEKWIPFVEIFSVDQESKVDDDSLYLLSGDVVGNKTAKNQIYHQSASSTSTKSPYNAELSLSFQNQIMKGRGTLKNSPSLHSLQELEHLNWDSFGEMLMKNKQSAPYLKIT